VAYEDLTLLADDWRDLLFPDLNDETFSDAYAQTIVFAMLLARVNGIAFDSTPLHGIARQLGKKHSLIGKAFSVLTDSDATEELRVIETLRRVIGAIDWSKLDDGQTNVYIELYEKFLAEYDPTLRKLSRSYYAPEPVARFMVDFVDSVLCSRLNRPWGFAAEDVVVVDPAMGTGTFLVEVIRTVAQTVDDKQGKGARPARLRELFQKRLVGFERQVAPYAVAELRLHQALRTRFDTDIPPTEVRFLTDALENPRAQQDRIRAAYKIIERLRSEANRIKRDVPVMVVIGNPPHVENTKGHAPWIEERRKPGLHPAAVRARPSLDEFRLPGGGRYESDLHAMHWYFWRWALWKVFEAHQDHPAVLVAFITPSSYMTGKAFAGMREYLRRTCDEGWIIDVSPEGNRSDPGTRIFGGVQRTLCIGIFARYGRENRDVSAAIWHIAIKGSRDEKFAQLQQIQACRRTLDQLWDRVAATFLAKQGPDWENNPSLCELMPMDVSRGHYRTRLGLRTRLRYITATMA
jgi:predicted helicase